MTKLEELKSKKAMKEAGLADYLEAHVLNGIISSDSARVVCDMKRVIADLKAQIEELEKQKPTYLLTYKGSDTICREAGEYDSIEEAVADAEKLLKTSDFIMVKRV